MHLLERRQQLLRRVAAEHERAPGDPQADAERGGVRAMAGDVADHDVDGAVGGLDGVVEVAAEQRPLASRPVVGGQPQRRVADQRRGQQAALQPRVLLGVGARELELLAGLLGAPALDRVADRARQPLPVDLALDQVVLRARGDGLDPAPLVVEAGEHEHRQVRAVGLDLVQRRQALRVGQVEIEQHAVDLLVLPAPGLRQRRGAHDLDQRAADREQLLDEQRVAVVVLDEQDADRG